MPGKNANAAMLDPKYLAIFEEYDLTKPCDLLRKNKLVRFWFIQKGPEDEPVLFMHRKRISPGHTKKVKLISRNKKCCGGYLLKEGNVVTAYTDDSTPGTFEKDARKLIKTKLASITAVQVKPIDAKDEHLNAKLEENVRDSDDTGGIELPEHYKDEEKGMGWRTELANESQYYPMLQNVLKKDALRKQLAEASGIAEDKLAAAIEKIKDEPKKLEKLLKLSHRSKTKYYDENEIDAATLRVNDEGQLVGKGGGVMDSPGRTGFAVHKETGDVRTFNARRESNETGGTDTHHHSSSVRGEEVISAGHMEISEGAVKKIDDQSGHYKPDATKTLAALRHLEDMGVKLMDDSLVNEFGFKVMNTRLVQAAKDLKKLEKDWNAINKERKASGEKPLKLPKEYDNAKKTLLDAGVWFKNKSTQIELLGKTGISSDEWKVVKGDWKKINKLVEKKVGVKNLFNESTNAGLLGSREAVNQQIGQATSRTLSKEQFEQTGGNEKQIRAKDKMQEELLGKVEKVKANKPKKDEPTDTEDESYVYESLEDVLGGSKKDEDAQSFTPPHKYIDTSGYAVDASGKRLFDVVYIDMEGKPINPNEPKSNTMNLSYTLNWRDKKDRVISDQQIKAKPTITYYSFEGTKIDNNYLAKEEENNTVVYQTFEQLGLDPSYFG